MLSQPHHYLISNYFIIKPQFTEGKCGEIQVKYGYSSIYVFSSSRFCFFHMESLVFYNFMPFYLYKKTKSISSQQLTSLVL